MATATSLLLPRDRGVPGCSYHHFIEKEYSVISTENKGDVSEVQGKVEAQQEENITLAMRGLLLQPQLIETHEDDSNSPSSMSDMHISNLSAALSRCSDLPKTRITIRLPGVKALREAQQQTWKKRSNKKKPTSRDAYIDGLHKHLTRSALDGTLSKELLSHVLLASYDNQEIVRKQMAALRANVESHKEKQEEWAREFKAYHEENHRLRRLLEISQRNNKWLEAEYEKGKGVQEKESFWILYRDAMETIVELDKAHVGLERELKEFIELAEYQLSILEHLGAETERELLMQRMHQIHEDKHRRSQGGT
ncbi:hypothetical protein BGX38DRAFT_1147910 [Terfezia claveryi]|nr:hypothetical protein BGX38DRAFT_1147910 [Terfezia claveryi]